MDAVDEERSSRLSIDFHSRSNSFSAGGGTATLSGDVLNALRLDSRVSGQGELELQ
jgi:hypothetical protein